MDSVSGLLLNCHRTFRQLSSWGGAPCPLFAFRTPLAFLLLCGRCLRSLVCACWLPHTHGARATEGYLSAAPSTVKWMRGPFLWNPVYSLEVLWLAWRDFTSGGVDQWTPLSVGFLYFYYNSLLFHPGKHWSPKSNRMRVLWECYKKARLLGLQDPVVKTPCFYCDGQVFDPWLGN